MQYSAFLSYSHTADGKLSPALQTALHQFAKPWYRLRAIRVFRDKSSLSANPALWPSIQNVLSESEYFLLMASPQSAESTWVTREVSWWLQNRSTDKMLILWTDGGLPWSENGSAPDWSRATGLSPQLIGHFKEEPLYVDLRWAKSAENLSLRNSQFRNAILDIAAPLHNKPKDELDGEDVHQYRRARQLMWSAIAFLSILLIIAGSAAFVAYQQRLKAQGAQKTAEVARDAAKASETEARKARDDEDIQRGNAVRSAQEATIQRDEAVRQRQAALSRYLLVKAESLKSGDYSQVEATALLRIEAGRRSQLFESNTALRDSLAALPILGVPHDRPRDMSFSADGKLFLSADVGSVQMTSLESRDVLWRKEFKFTTGAALSPDGHFVAVQDYSEGSLIVLDARSGRPLWNGEGTDVSFSPDSRYMGATIRSGGAVLLDAASGRVYRFFKLSEEPLNTMFSPDGKRFAAFGHGSVLLFNFENGSERILDQSSGVWALRFSSRVGGLMTLDEGGIKFYTPDGDPLPKRIPPPAGAPKPDDWLIDPKGTYIATEGADVISLWYVSDSGELAPQPTYYPFRRSAFAGASTFAFSETGAYLAVGSDDLTIVYETSRNNELFRFRHPESLNSLSVAFSRDDSRLAIGSEHSAQVFELRPGKVLSAIPRAPRETVDFVCDGRYLETYDDEAREAIRLFDPGTGAQKAEFQLGKFSSVETSCDGNYAAVQSYEDSHKGRVLTKDGRQILALNVPESISHLGITRDSRTLTVASSSRGDQYDLSTGRLRRSFELKEKFDSDYVSPDGQFLFGSGFIGSNSVYFIYRIADQRLQALAASTRRIVFSPDDRLFAFSEEKGPISVYEAASEKLMFQGPYQEEETSLTFSRDGRLLASYDGKRIQVFDLSSRLPIAQIEQETHSISFSKDLTRLYTVTLGAEWEVVEHPLSTTDLIDENCRRLTRNLSPEEWNQYLPDEPYRRTCPLIH
jgi:WD40 repeat protein